LSRIISILNFDVCLTQSLATPPATRWSEPQPWTVVSTTLHAIIAPDAFGAADPGQLVGSTRGADARDEGRGWFAGIGVSQLAVG
jgi:hypothetical protein